MTEPYPPPEWLPIATAPKDGTTIDLWDAYDKQRRCGARWGYHYVDENGQPVGEESWGPWLGANGQSGPFVVNPTHWRLPPAAEVSGPPARIWVDTSEAPHLIYPEGHWCPTTEYVLADLLREAREHLADSARAIESEWPDGAADDLHAMVAKIDAALGPPK